MSISFVAEVDKRVVPQREGEAPVGWRLSCLLDFMKGSESCKSCSHAE